MSANGKAAAVFAGAGCGTAAVVSGRHVAVEAAAGGRADRTCTFDGLLLKKPAYPCPCARIYF